MSTKKIQIIGNLGTKIYTQNDEPVGAAEGALWVDLDANGTTSSGGSFSDVAIDTTLTQSGQAADAKIVGDKFVELEQKINSGVTVSDDGNGNLTFETVTSNMVVADDGNGNIVIS